MTREQDEARARTRRTLRDLLNHPANNLGPWRVQAEAVLSPLDDDADEPILFAPVVSCEDGTFRAKRAELAALLHNEAPALLNQIDYLEREVAALRNRCGETTADQRVFLDSAAIQIMAGIVSGNMSRTALGGLSPEVDARHAWAAAEALAAQRKGV